MCLNGHWAELTKSFTDEGVKKGFATRYANETRIFFEDTGSTLWITFIGELLFWGFLASAAPARHADGDGVWRTVLGGWRSTDRNGDPLTKDGLSGSVTKLAAYRGTSCDVDVAEYVVRRINGQKNPEVERALTAQNAMRRSALEMMRLLGPRDFEILVDLVFSTSGWRRLGVIGKTQKTLDLDLILPSTSERAFVQIKSKTTSAELKSYVNKLSGDGPHKHMFYVFHSGEAQVDDERVTVLGPEKIAEMVVDAGLVGWLIRKTS